MIDILMMMITLLIDNQIPFSAFTVPSGTPFVMGELVGAVKGYIFSVDLAIRLYNNDKAR
jgi:hypothetical protein